MELVGDDVKVTLGTAPEGIHLILESVAGTALAVLRPDHARAVAQELLEMADDLDANPGGMLN